MKVKEVVKVIDKRLTVYVSEEFSGTYQDYSCLKGKQKNTTDEKEVCMISPDDEERINIYCKGEEYNVR